MLKYFSRYGEVIDCVVMKNPATGKSRGFGFVTFKDPSCVETVLANGPHVLDGRQVRIAKALGYLGFTCY
jgi:RNA-binding protein Musashi